MRPLVTATISLALFVGLPAIPASVRAAESYDNCTGFVDSVPATITTQGTWCLRQDLSTAISAGHAINIATNNVTLDCNNFKLGGLAAGFGTAAFGIYASGRSNTTIRNCNIRGFLYGVALLSGKGDTVEGNRFDGNTFTAVLASGDGLMIRRNQVRNTGGSLRHPHSSVGINTIGAAHILNNVVGGVLPAGDYSGNGTGYGIDTSGNVSGSIGGNRINGVFGIGTGLAHGIYNRQSGRISVINNHVIGDPSGGSVGMTCSNDHGRARDNIVNGFATGIVGCRDDGNSL